MSMFQWLANLFGGGCREKGCISLTHGKHHVMVKTKCAPCRIWLNMCCADHQVCGGHTSMAGVSIVPGGFVLVTDIRAHKCTIHWVSECACCCKCDDEDCCESMG